METLKKKSKSETGHMKNLMNYEDLLARYTALGARYNPANPDLQLINLQRLFQEGQVAMGRLTLAITMNNTATNLRADLFDRLGPVSTSIVNYLIAGGSSAKTIEDARGFQRKINGGRSARKETESNSTPDASIAEETAVNGTENGESATDKTRSISRQSYDLKTEHLAGLLSLAQNEPKFQPHESELQIPALLAFLQQLRDANTSKAHADAELEVARRERSRIFYHPDNGMVTRALQSKAYAKAVLGASSDDFKHIQRIRFRMIG